MALDHRTRSLDDEGHRKIIHPTEVNGFWKKRREYLQFTLIFFFLSLPWLKIGGRPLLLLDIFERRFSVLGILFQSHDVPLFFLFLISFILIFGFMTTLFGRVWCGWACPQTVFIEAVFRRIEGWIEGKSFQRRKDEVLPLEGARLVRRLLKWVAFVIVTLVITHSFLAIFTGPEKLAEMIRSSPAESPRAFLFIVLSSLIILFDFGWFREQFCIVICPYGKIQSVFQDTKTKTVTYDAKRGEPRGAVRKNEAGSPHGDCVDCGRCVQVCPTGVDIRNGSSQLECVACTACIDACDDVMVRLKKERGLIRYASVEETSVEMSERSKAQARSVWLRGRTLLYGGALFIVFSAIIYIGETRTLAMVEVFKNRGDPFTTFEIPGGGKQFGNLFIAEIASHTEAPLEIRFELDSSTGAELIMPNNPIEIRNSQFLRQPFTVKFKKESLTSGRRSARLLIHVHSKIAGPGNPHSEIQEKEVTLVGPF